METTKNAMYYITKNASIFLLIFACLSFGALIVFKVEYWLQALQIKFPLPLAWIMAGVLALIIEGVRFALMVSSAEDIAQGKKISFWLGIIGSAALLIYEVCYMAHKVGNSWSTTDSTYTHLFMFLSILGMLLEIRLCLLLKDSKLIKEKTAEQISTPTNVIPGFGLGKYISSNSSENANTVK